MKHFKHLKTRLAFVVSLCAALSASAAGGAAQSQAEVDAANASTLTFIGEVTKLNAATMSVVPVSANTNVVRVFKIIKNADPGMDYLGKEITVWVNNPQGIKEHETYVFYTTGWLAGNGIAVQALFFRPAPLTASASNSDDWERDLIKRSERAETLLLGERFANADLVIQGKVTDVEDLKIQPDTEGEGTEPQRSALLLELNPKFKRATVEVTSQLVPKGGEPAKSVKVLFPSSTEEQWAHAPKLKTGDSGLFILKKARTNEILTKILRLVKGKIEGLETDYIILDASDFQPQAEQKQVNDAVKAVKNRKQ